MLSLLDLSGISHVASNTALYEIHFIVHLQRLGVSSVDALKLKWFTLF